MEEVSLRADRYAKERNLTFTKDLGAGVHGIVRIAKDNVNFRRFAVKVHRYEDPYQREKAAYLRFEELGLNAVRGFRIPELLRWNDSFRAIEMTVVVRPFVVDFAETWCDEAPDLPENVGQDEATKILEQFGERADEVQRVLAVLRSHGLFMFDVSPSNIAFAE